MKTAILLISFGTTVKEAREKGIESIYRELSDANRELPIYQAYTSSVVIRALKKEGIHRNTVEEAILEAWDDGIQRLYVLPTHIIPGLEYEKMMKMLERYRLDFEVIEIAPSVLSEEADCDKLVPVWKDMLGFDENTEYILMGHGTEHSANVRYEQMQRAFEMQGFFNVHMALVEARPDLEDVIERLRKRKVQKVILHPFLLVAGDHVHNDMRQVFAKRLKEEGYEVETVVKGLGEYPQFRTLYLERIREMREKTEGNR